MKRFVFKRKRKGERGNLRELLLITGGVSKINVRCEKVRVYGKMGLGKSMRLRD